MSPLSDSAATPDAGVRLAKRLAEQLGCSRREAELYIECGAVQVDGVQVEELGFRVLPHQQVTVRAGAKPQPVPPVTLLVHQPHGCTLQDLHALLVPERYHAAHAPTPVQVLNKHFRQQQLLLPLPQYASGLVVLTQDRRVERRLTEDAWLLEQECLAEVRGTLAADGFERLRDGTAVPGIGPVKASWQSEQRLRLAFKDIDPNDLSTLCEAVGLRLVGLRRQRIGRLSLARLPEGQWRYALPWERF